MQMFQDFGQKPIYMIMHNSRLTANKDLTIGQKPPHDEMHDRKM